MKRLLGLTLALVLSFGVIAFADGPGEGSGRPSPTDPPDLVVKFMTILVTTIP
jgi:hypothetical protein